MSITLPPYQWGTFKDDSIEIKVTQAHLRARDLEVARLVLEGAAQSCFDQQRGWASDDHIQCADTIRNLEVRHHE